MCLYERSAADSLVGPEIWQQYWTRGVAERALNLPSGFTDDPDSEVIERYAKRSPLIAKITNEGAQNSDETSLRTVRFCADPNDPKLSDCGARSAGCGRRR